MDKFFIAQQQQHKLVVTRRVVSSLCCVLLWFSSLHVSLLLKLINPGWQGEYVIVTQL
jgi:hypothetical protein